MQKTMTPKILLVFFLFFIANINGQKTLFSEVSDQIGLSYHYPGNDFQLFGGGIMVFDFNNDGWEDVFQPGGIFVSKLWMNNKGKFVDVTTKYGLDSLLGYNVLSAVSADYDNDGFQDFFIANYGTGFGRGDKKAPALLRNKKGKGFEMIHLNEILPVGHYSAACWGDVNKDGFSDLYITNYIGNMGELSDTSGKVIGYDPICLENRLLINQKGKGFVEAAQLYGVNDFGCGFTASFTDADNDGDQDLLLLNDFGEWTKIGNKFYRNDFPLATFTDVSETSGFSKLMYGMGIGQSDYDGDGDFDYYVTNIGKNYFFNNTNGIFTDVSKSMNLELTYEKDSIKGTSWSPLFFDSDLDGDLDLYVAKGNIPTLVPVTVVKDANKFFINENGVFINTSAGSGMDDILSHRGSATFDYDHDGDLDIISAVVKLPWGAFANREQKLKFFQNGMPQGNFVGIKLVGENDINKDAFGCKVLFEQNGLKMLKEVDGGSGHASQSTRILYFGLGTATTLQKATIYWINGEQIILENLKSGLIYEVHSNKKVKLIKQ
jgi:hypothetical protein